jgi:hypothetical protein
MVIDQAPVKGRVEERIEYLGLLPHEKEQKLL